MIESKKKIVFCLKLAITIGLCILILVNADWINILEAITNANAIIIAVVFLGMLINIVVCAKKWQILLSIHSISIKLTDLTKYYLTGLFFSNFLPSTIGGDGYRIYAIYKQTDTKAGAVFPVLMERISGIAILLMLGLIAGIINYLHYGDSVSRAGILFGFSGTVIAIIFTVLVLNNKYKNWVSARSFIPNKVKQIIAHLNIYSKKHEKLLQAGLISILFYLFLFIYRYLLLHAVGETCDFTSLAVVIMLSTLIANLPISINGIGLLDGSFIFLISTYGVGYDSAITYMILQRTLTSLISLFGGVGYLKYKETLKTGSKADVRQLKDTFF